MTSHSRHDTLAQFPIYNSSTRQWMQLGKVISSLSHLLSFLSYLQFFIRTTSQISKGIEVGLVNCETWSEDYTVRIYWKDTMAPAGSLAFVMLTASLPLLMEYYELRYRQQDKLATFQDNPPDANLPLNETFDYVIVGAGTAGCVLARRLSERYSVLLLEAGGDPPPMESITTLVSYTKYLPHIHWFYNSSVQKDSSLRTGGKIQVTGGKMMGGSGSHNNVQYERGHPLDFDQWANFTQDSSWKFRNVLKYFLKSEDYRGQYSTTSGQHRAGGLLRVVKSNFTFREDLFFNAGKELGYKVGIDSNGPQTEGFSAAEYNRKKGRRVSTYTAYVQPIEKKRRTLVIRKYSLVSKVIIERMKAIGVEYEHHGIPRVASAKRDVILSAGSYITPIILMRSGIGPRDQVKPDKLIKELPVGHNAQDHVIVKMPFIKVQDKSVFTYSPSTVTFEDFSEFATQGTGFLAAYEALHEAFLVSTRAKGEHQPGWPDIQLYFGHDFDNGTDVLTCNVNLNRERSRGRVLINESAVTLEEQLRPIIDYNFFGDDSDFDVLFEGIKVCQQIVERTKTFQGIGAKFAEDVIEDCKTEFKTGPREYWKCFIRQRATSNFHLTSTATMGPLENNVTVVDSKLRVFGIQNLRVIDASVMPFVTNANINAAVIMIAEKAAEEMLYGTS